MKVVLTLTVAALLLGAESAFAEEPWWEKYDDPVAEAPATKKPWEKYQVKAQSPKGPFHVHCYQEGRQIFSRDDLYEVSGRPSLLSRTEDGRSLVMVTTQGTTCFFEER